MFERFGDLPLHVLVIHAAVVLLPASALAATTFAIAPRWRWLLRWPVLLLGPASAVVAFVARESGQAFVAAVPELDPLVREHEMRGDLLFWISLGFAAACIVAALLLPGGSPLASGRGARTGGNRIVAVAIAVVLVGVAVALAVQTIRTGDSGAKAVWDGRLPAG